MPVIRKVTATEAAMVPAVKASALASRINRVDRLCYFGKNQPDGLDSEPVSLPAGGR